MLNLDGGVRQYLVNPELTESVSSKRYNRIVDIAYALACAVEARNRTYANIIGLETVAESIEIINETSVDKLTRDFIMALYLFDGSMDRPCNGKYVSPAGFNTEQYNKDKKAVFEENRHLQQLLKSEMVNQALQLIYVGADGGEHILDGGDAETNDFVNDKKGVSQE